VSLTYRNSVHPSGDRLVKLWRLGRRRGNERHDCNRREFPAIEITAGHDAVAIDLHLSQRPASLPALSRHRPSSHHCAAFYSRRTTNLVVLPADRSFTPTHATMPRRKPIAATASIQPLQARTCGKIPIAPAALPLHTSRDFVPWRFLDAGRNSAWIVSAFRRPKTCTNADIALANHRKTPNKKRPEDGFRIAFNGLT
jgi:hypothetical protein